jgi:hypothetical protein
MADVGPGTLTDLLIAIDDVEPHPDNPRVGDVDEIAASLEANGLFRPLTVQRSTGYVLTGNHTWKAAKRLGWTEIAATYLDVDDEAARRIVLADNRTSDLGTYDDAALAELLRIVAQEDAGGLAGTGYGDDDLDDLLASLQETPPPPGSTSTGDATGVGDGNVKADLSYEEFLERYANRTIRSLVADYQLPVYQWIVGAMDTIRQDGESNADVIARLVSEASGTSIPITDEE